EDAPQPKSDTHHEVELGSASDTHAVPTVGARPETAAARASATDSLDGYHFLECVARLPVAEVWRAQSPAGRRCLIKLLFDCDAIEGGLDRLRSLRHEVLADAEYVRSGPNRLAVIVDAGDQTLGERLKECQREGLPGIPRGELLEHLRTVA